MWRVAGRWAGLHQLLGAWAPMLAVRGGTEVLDQPECLEGEASMLVPLPALVLWTWGP